MTGLTRPTDYQITHSQDLLGDVVAITLPSVSALSGRTGSDTDLVLIKAWYAGGVFGGGRFVWDSTVTKDKHDGGFYISPTVPYNTAVDFIKGVGETDPSGAGCWRRIPDTYEINADAYGLSNTIDAGVVMSAVSKIAALLYLKVRVRAGRFTIRTTWNHTWIANGSDRYPIPHLEGAGGEFTTFVVDYASFGDSAYGAIFTGSKHLGQDGFEMSGIGFQTNSNNEVAGQLYRGAPVKFTDIWGFNIKDLRIARAQYGVTFDNVIYGIGMDWRINGCHAGTRFRHTPDIVGGGGGTGLNAVTLINCRWADCANQCIVASESHAVKLLGCSFEGNGNRMDGSGNLIPGDACIRLTQVGSAGGIGWSIDTCYFESNRIRDIFLNYTLDIDVTQVIRDCIFNKTSGNPPAAPRITVSNGRGSNSITKVMKLLLEGCNFNDYSSGGTVMTDVEYAGWSLASQGSGHAQLMTICCSKGLITSMADGVTHKYFEGEIATVGVTSAGVLSNNRGAKTCSKTGTGVYAITCSEPLTGATVSINMRLAGFATYSLSGNVITVTTVNSSGAAQDTGFDLRITA